MKEAALYSMDCLSPNFPRLLDLDRKAEERREVFIQTHSSEWREKVRAFYHPVISFREGCHPKQRDLFSALGGLPHLEAGTTWPCWQGTPLEYLCRLNLAELTDIHSAFFPQTGTLSFFCRTPDLPFGVSLREKGSGVVIFCPDGAECLELQHPDKAYIPTGYVPITFFTHIANTATTEQQQEYSEYLSTLPNEKQDELFNLEVEVWEDSRSYLRALSHPEYIRRDGMEEELILGAQVLGLSEDTEWTMLLQLDTLENPKWDWGGCILCFWIPTVDLSSGRFDRIWAIAQG